MHKKHLACREWNDFESLARSFLHALGVHILVYFVHIFAGTPTFLIRRTFVPSHKCICF